MRNYARISIFRKSETQLFLSKVPIFEDYLFKGISNFLIVRYLKIEEII